MKVLKRDGGVDRFNPQKIENAVIKALMYTSIKVVEFEKVAKDVSKKVEKKITGKDGVSVSDIQEEVEEVLMSSAQTREAARKYIEYRHDRDVAREEKSKLYSDIEGFLSNKDDEFTKENANKPSHLVNTHRDLLSGILSKHLALTQILPKDVAKEHKEGFIHVHDLDYIISPLTNCALINYRDMLENGFKVGNARIDKPKSIGVAATVLSQIILACSSSQYGK